MVANSSVPDQKKIAIHRMDDLSRNDALIDNLNLLAIALAGLGLFGTCIFLLIHGPHVLAVVAALMVAVGAGSMIPVTIARRRPKGGVYFAVPLTLLGIIAVFIQIAAV